MKKRGLLTLPVLLVAVLALALGSVGSAAAGGLTKSKVKSIAAKVVAKKAPGLSVGHASTADSATAAATATTATNSANLNGAPPATYLNRIAQGYTQAATSVPSGANNQILGPVTITVPAGVNFLRIDGAATLSGGAAQYDLHPQVDSACSSSGLGFDHRQYGDASNQETTSFTGVFPVAPGAHSVVMCLDTSAGTTAFSRELVVEAVPVGSTGGATLVGGTADGGSQGAHHTGSVR